MFKIKDVWLSDSLVKSIESKLNSKEFGLVFNHKEQNTFLNESVQYSLNKDKNNLFIKISGMYVLCQDGNIENRCYTLDVSEKEFKCLLDK